LIPEEDPKSAPAPDPPTYQPTLPLPEKCKKGLSITIVMALRHTAGAPIPIPLPPHALNLLRRRSGNNIFTSFPPAKPPKKKNALRRLFKR